MKILYYNRHFNIISV